MKLEYDIYCQKVTHIGRVRCAEDGMEFGATVEGVKAQGNWSQGGSFHASYHRALPVDALMANAGFNGEKRNDYFISRDKLGMCSGLMVIGVILLHVQTPQRSC